MRARPPIPPPRPLLPRPIRTRIYAQQNGRCAACGDVLILGFFDFFACAEASEVLDPRGEMTPLIALCWACAPRADADS